MNIMLHTEEVDLITSEVTVKNFLNVNEREITRNNKFANVGCVKPLKDYPNYYISDEGKVYSTKSGKTLELKASKSRGYLYASFWINGNLYRKQIHRLVLSTFSPIPEMNKYQVNHKDENRENNKLDNLEWCTAKYNNNYGTRIEKFVAALKKNSKERAKNISKALKGKKKSPAHRELMIKTLEANREKMIEANRKKVLQYDQNYNLITSFSSIAEAGEALGISHSTIWRYCNSLKLFRGKYYLQYEN